MVPNEFVEKNIQDARAWLLGSIEERLGRYADSARRCVESSPLEAAFLIWFDCVAMMLDTSVHLERQKEIIAGGNRYRLDFSVVHRDWQAHHDLKIAIELDGHAFHEKTLDQVTRRNQRDRDLQADGWRVLHFSFSEFARSPLGTALDAHKAILDEVVARFTDERNKLALLENFRPKGDR